MRTATMRALGSLLAAVLLGATGAAPAFSQQAPRQDVTGPPVQPIATASAVSKERLGAVTSVRELPDGRLLVNDVAARRLLLMDTTMTTVGAVLDSATAIANAYGARPGALLPFRGDSSLFVDAASFAMLVIDPAGKVVRVRSVWRVQDLPYVMGMGVFGTPGVDARGRMVYRVPARPAPPKVPPPAGVPYVPQDPDSAFVVAADLDTRKVDTLAVVRVPVSGLSVRKNPNGGFLFEQMTNPLPITDEWAVLSDGTVAVLRERDYRVEYHNPDGSVTSSGKLPYPWQRLADEDKQRIVDSVTTALRKTAANNYITSLIRWVNQFGRSYPDGLKLPDGYTPPPGLPKEWKLPPGVKLPDNYLYACPPGTDPLAGLLGGGAAAGGAPQGSRVVVNTLSAPGAAGAPPAGATGTPGAPGASGASSASGAPPADRVTGLAGALAAGMAAGAAAAPAAGGAAPSGNRSPEAMMAAAAAAAGMRCFPGPVSVSIGNFRPPPPTVPSVHVVPPSQLPDYRPPITGGAARADLDGNLWIRPVQVKPVPGGPIFDVVNRQGELVARYQLPAGYTVAGFGRGRVVYLTMRDMTGIHLARVRLK